jgi:hypothetical protein
MRLFLNLGNKNNEIFGFLAVLGGFSKHRLTIQSNQTVISNTRRIVLGYA